MTATLIEGKLVAEEIRAELKKRIAALEKEGIRPGLAVVLVGEDPASQVYVGMKEKSCAELGIFSDPHHLPAGTTQAELLTLVRRLNADSRINGILVQLPLPDQIDETAVIEAIDPDKDVDGFHPVTLGRLVIGVDTFRPCTPAGVQELLLRSGVNLEGKSVVIVGRSNIVGKPLANMLLQKAPGANATVTIAHSRTADLPAVVKGADVVVAAMGSPEFIRGEWLKPGAVVIDVGVNRVDDPRAKRGYRLVGDVHFESAVKVASRISPVPGGVGPMTIVMLMTNTVLSAERTLKKRTGGK
ncbi:MAG: bifunctional 5,10-methylene-tetrahydrofolate dehydrogenase/5,10-methylene-tetrahydrofolate cyclohydrolase [Candidatus Glassbacteria bacterium RIFCSPLOWO2_12_FULL_58_11]|uniref:Bifunctional protein FolD n=2 Tax=Candidatus Glassiibacteriota TaxID=1817805 RepID=A0A1F5Z3C9_9BACT|nr:MAG: bifunctional 5,10-methylene-tetrahydrofolate dehydrogenase/5,10-methylene-tetrahydrofolate cyclohydrolase [Candidatus Glassbacteria bacterium GWA2_58_10]OGG06873.1 MAG: bifunctional 5,10-methylene-tetrahydrofolate dehydrogenase/5,10-methylene-tetrahydrofolate cyclohydrolase [Candidatus Glassbacteria bacterium RIFCSPLOWO2_12_FULL_58_11]